MTKYPIISAKNLSIGYDDFLLMKNISFDINKGDIFIIMCGSGCGKSSLLKVMTGLIPAKGGHIYIEGKNFTNAS